MRKTATCALLVVAALFVLIGTIEKKTGHRCDRSDDAIECLLRTE